MTAIVCASGWTAPNSPMPNADSERARLPILKVFSAKDGEALYRSYLVKWKDQEAVVTDTMAKTTFKAGDTATVLVMKHKYPGGKPGPDLLSFALMP